MKPTTALLAIATRPAAAEKKEHILPGDVYNIVRYNQRLALGLVR